MMAFRDVSRFVITLVLAGCGGGGSDPGEPPPTIVISEAKAVRSPEGEPHLYMTEEHTPQHAEVLVDGAREGDQSNFWPLSAAKRTVGKHTITVEVVLAPLHSDGKQQRTAKTVEIDVVASPAEFSLMPIENEAGTTIGCVNCGNDRRYANYDKNLTVEFRLTVGPGDVVSWQGKKLPAAQRTHELTFDFAAGFADVPVANLFNLFEGVPLPLSITTPDGGTIRDHPGVDGVTAAIAIFNRPTHDIGDPNKSAGADRNVLILSQEGGHRSKLVGVAAKVRDVDLVAVILEKEVYRRSCGTYKNDEGRQAKREIVGTALDVRVFDRRTGSIKGMKVFPPPPGECPKSIVTASDDLFEPVHGDSDGAERFITAFVKP